MMNKSLLAATALMAASSLAHAQTTSTTPSNIVIYGIMDAGLLITDPTADGQKSTVGVGSGNKSASRFGFRGTEDIGSGWKVNMTMEGGITIDNGVSSQANRLFGRQIFIGLGQDRLGELRFGRQYAPSYEVFAPIDPFALSWGDGGMQNTFSAVDGYRLDNTVEYRAPIFSGLQWLIAYSFNGGAGAVNAIQGEVPGIENNQAVADTSLLYAAGPIQLAASYDRVNCPHTTVTPVNGTCSLSSKGDQTMWQAGGSYDFGFAKLMAAYGREKNIFSSIMGANTVSGTETIAGVLRNFATSESREYIVGATVPIGGGAILGSYQRRFDISPARAENLRNDLIIYALGYDYYLSKRTTLYAYSSLVNGERNLENSVLYDRAQYALGVRHTF